MCVCRLMIFCCGWGGIGAARLGCLSLRYFRCAYFGVKCEKLLFNNFGQFQGAFGRVFILLDFVPGAQVIPACISPEVGYCVSYCLSFWLVLIVPGVHVVLVYPVVICFTLFCFTLTDRLGRLRVLKLVLLCPSYLSS